MLGSELKDWVLLGRHKWRPLTHAKDFKNRAKPTTLTKSFLHHDITADRDNFGRRYYFGSAPQRFLLLVPASLIWCFYEAVHHERRVHLGTLLTSWQKPRNQENKYTDTSEHPSSFRFIYSGSPTYWINTIHIQGGHLSGNWFADTQRWTLLFYASLNPTHLTPRSGITSQLDIKTHVLFWAAKNPMPIP